MEDDYSKAALVQSPSWIFDCIWTSCSSTRTCNVSIATTIIFSFGRPHKCIKNDNNDHNNIIKYPIALENSESSNVSMNSREINKCITLCKDIFQTRNTPDTNINDSDDFCMVCTYIIFIFLFISYFSYYKLYISTV